MKITDMITKQDLGEPYNRLLDFLELEDIVRLEQIYGGQQMQFNRKCTDIKKEYPELYTFGEKKARKLIRTLGDMRVYFPSLKKSAQDKIKNLIIREFNGYNYNQLARKYGYTERNIRYILQGRAKCSPIDENQITLAELLSN